MTPDDPALKRRATIGRPFRDETVGYLPRMALRYVATFLLCSSMVRAKR